LQQQQMYLLFNSVNLFNNNTLRYKVHWLLKKQKSKLYLLEQEGRGELLVAKKWRECRPQNFLEIFFSRHLYYRVAVIFVSYTDTFSFYSKQFLKKKNNCFSL
jgi:hypothetical protein